MPAEIVIFRGLEEVPPDFGPCALTVGNFDGVHAGHRQILRRVAQLAAERGWRPAVLTFDPHPARIVAAGRAPKLMTLPLERCQLLAEEGIQEVLILPFDSHVAAWTPEYFVREVLVSRLQCKAVLVGRDFRFGHHHAGDTALLARLGAECGFLTELAPAVTMRGQRVSSSLIRGLVEAGRVALACRYLTQPFFLSGPVVKGQGIGSKQTVPTLNLRPAGEVLPQTGVYVTTTQDRDSGRCWNSITNVGYRPTFQGDSLTVETFLLQPLESSPHHIRVAFHLRLRGERKFESPEALKSQILRDVRKAQRWFSYREKLGLHRMAK